MTNDDTTPAGGDPNDSLLSELRAAATRLDPVPEESVLAARSALAWRTMDAELAELSADSAVADEPLAGVRGGNSPRLLSFDATLMSVELEVTAIGRTRRLLGQLLPPQAGHLEVHHEKGTITVAADELGRFRADGLVPGPTRVRWWGAGEASGSPVDTEWFLT